MNPWHEMVRFNYKQRCTQKGIKANFMRLDISLRLVHGVWQAGEAIHSWLSASTSAAGQYVSAQMSAHSLPVFAMLHSFSNTLSKTGPSVQLRSSVWNHTHLRPHTGENGMKEELVSSMTPTMDSRLLGECCLPALNDDPKDSSAWNSSWTEPYPTRGSPFGWSHIFTVCFCGVKSPLQIMEFQVENWQVIFRTKSWPSIKYDIA